MRIERSKAVESVLGAAHNITRDCCFDGCFVIAAVHRSHAEGVKECCRQVLTKNRARGSMNAILYGTVGRVHGIRRKRGAFDSAHALYLNFIKKSKMR